MSLYLAARVLSAYSFCRSFARASLSLNCCCQYGSVARYLQNSTWGSLSRSFLPISSSAGDIPVTVCGVTLYWNRKSWRAFRQSLASSREIRTIFKRVSLQRSTSPLLCGHYGTHFLCSIPRYSKKASNSFNSNGGPSSLRTVPGNPCVLKIASIDLITCWASVFFRRIASIQRER